MRTLHRPLVLATCMASFVACASLAGTGSPEVILPVRQLSVLFGGANGQVCGVDPSCRDVLPSCATYANDSVKCNSSTGQYAAKQFAKMCVSPTPACPTCDCTDYTKDQNGNWVYCIDSYWCHWTGIPGVPISYKCEQSTWSGGVIGHVSCADNQP